MEAVTITAGLALLACFGGACLYILVKGTRHGNETSEETRKAARRQEADDSPEAGLYR